MHGFISLMVALSFVQALQTPVLEFPEPGLDDPAAYEGYSTRFFRDSHRNAFQIYLDTRSGRVVHVWADATNASAAFTVRDTLGHAAPVAWGDAGAHAAADGHRRTMRYRLASELDALEIAWFLLGTMRQERDFQGWRWHRRPYGDGRFVLREFLGLVENLERLPAAERASHLSLLNAPTLAELRARLQPRITLTQDNGAWTVLVEHTTLDGKNHMTIELRGDLRASTAGLTDDVVTLRARSPGGIQFDVTATTDAPPLTPLDRNEIFNDAFEAFYARQQHVADSLHRRLPAVARADDPRVTAFRRLERAVRGLELLSSEEKLMAALPNYATYFGRDQMMSALMFEPIASVDLQELVIASVLRKLAPSGNVSHEEALGGQAIRESAAQYNKLIRAWEERSERDAAAAAAQLARARELLANLQEVRENYRMVDDDFQLPVLVDRYLSRPDVLPDRKRGFLTAPAGSGGSRLDALLRNLSFGARLARPYAEQPTANNLVSFFHRDTLGWLPGSWRDSRAGYGNGRFGMDVNVIWVPNALGALERILTSLEGLGLSAQDAVSQMQLDASALEGYLRDPETLRAAIATWRQARRHFHVRLDPSAVRGQVEALLTSLSGQERDYWRRRLSEDSALMDPLSFLALSLDEQGRPIAAANTDPATALFLEDYTGRIVGGTTDPDTVLEMLDSFTRPYPVGLFVEGLGQVVVNDAYASPAVQQRFRDDLYHSPRVVWGREVNLLLLGLARQIKAAYDSSGRLRNDSKALRSYVDALHRALEATHRAVEASGMRHNELWSYRIDGGTLRPVRYGESSDIQLWNVTDLAVRFALDGVPPR